ncbi:MAG: riboflavin kinase [bacterium]|nr:riboflavin kinase [bacterium]
MYQFWGKVRKNKQRGKSLGFPTANINLAKNIPEGIYISQAKIETFIYPALTFIGTAKTFNEKKFQAETYILNFDQSIYGKWISVKLLKKIRGNKKFNSAKDLIAQMKKDEQEARNYFSKLS